MSTPLSPDNDYRYPPQPAPAPWNREVADALHASIGARIRALEARRDELQAVIDDLRLFGLQRLDTAIVPLIDDVEAELASLRTQVAQTLASNAQIISDFQAVTAVNLTDLDAQLDEIQGRFDVIRAGGLDAADVRESAARVFVAPAEKAEIAALRGDLGEAETGLAAVTATAAETAAAVAGVGDRVAALETDTRARQIARLIAYSGVR